MQISPVGKRTKQGWSSLPTGAGAAAPVRPHSGAACAPNVSTPPPCGKTIGPLSSAGVVCFLILISCLVVSCVIRKASNHPTPTAGGQGPRSLLCSALGCTVSPWNRKTTTTDGKIFFPFEFGEPYSTSEAHEPCRDHRVGLRARTTIEL